MSKTTKTEITTLPSGASYPTFLEPLTKNETALLRTYEKIKYYEKEAARLKAEEAKRRLEEADERYMAKVRERERAEGGGEGDDDGNEEKPRRNNPGDERDHLPDADESGDEDEGGDAGTAARRRKREEEIHRLRQDVNAARDAESVKEARKEAAREKEEALRRAMLGEEGDASSGDEDDAESKKRPLAGTGHEDDEDDEDEGFGFGGAEGHAQRFSGAGISIKKKRKPNPDNPWEARKPAPSLIANIGGGATPVHDFSRKLGMGQAGRDGSVLFPREGAAADGPWRPPDKAADPLDGCLELELPDFAAAGGSGGNDTVAVKFHAPSDSARFSLNIVGPAHDRYNDILFHFNPRQFQKGGQLVVNAKKGSMWGNDIAVPLQTLPMVFGVEACTLIVQINDEGFDIFVEGVHCARLEHRDGVPAAGSLFLQCPSTDDYGNPEAWRVSRVWWGRKPPMAKEETLAGVAGVNRHAAVHPRKLFVSGLARLHSEPEVDLRRAELERAFRKYGGPTGAVTVSVKKDSTFAFVECCSEQQAELAMSELGRKYRLNRARRTKHEALLDGRAAKEAAEKGTAGESVDWD